MTTFRTSKLVQDATRVELIRQIDSYKVGFYRLTYPVPCSSPREVARAHHGWYMYAKSRMKVRAHDVFFGL